MIPSIKMRSDEMKGMEGLIKVSETILEFEKKSSKIRTHINLSTFPGDLSNMI